jgi:hypothetical protein
MHTKKYRASPLTAKKNRTVSGGGKKLSGKLKIYPPPPPPPQKSNGPSLSKKNMLGKVVIQVMFSCHAITKPRPIPIPNSNLL